MREILINAGSTFTFVVNILQPRKCLREDNSGASLADAWGNNILPIYCWAARLLRGLNFFVVFSLIKFWDGSLKHVPTVSHRYNSKYSSHRH